MMTAKLHLWRSTLFSRERCVTQSGFRPIGGPRAEKPKGDDILLPSQTMHDTVLINADIFSGFLYFVDQTVGEISR